MYFHMLYDLRISFKYINNACIDTYKTIAKTTTD